MLELNDVLEALTGQRPQIAPQIISEACVDSRHAIPASLFVALLGEQVDGHVYIADAFARKATAALIEQDLSDQFPVLDLRTGYLPENLQIPEQSFCILVNDCLEALQKIAAFWRNKLDLRVIGITGSIGKSTTKDLVAEVLGEKFRVLKNQGNYNNEIGLPLTILRLGLGHQVAIMEMGFYLPGEIKLLCEIAKPQVGMITNIGPVHAERAGSQETIAKGKGELIASLPAAPIGTAILNYDDPYTRPMNTLTDANIFYYGLNSEADLWADQIESKGLSGIKFRLHYQNETIHVRAPLIGRHSVHTILRAASLGLVEGMSWPEIISGLQRGRSQLRLVTVFTESGALLLDDSYNASPESTLAALNLLDDMKGKRKIAVLGDMLELGSYEEISHQKVGIRVSQVCNELFALGERSKTTAKSAQDAGMPSKNIHWFANSLQVIEPLKKHLDEGDVVLVKGSLGMKMARIINALEKTS
ncbi:MAG: UDP-N-acetylmuramoyl-tripeptide--D-alanyl-D-alanine ligase [Anaerolineaceae bacterium]|nr:UDP-N-acetylmuramoyl-tripeptide--D-alanyl-D-alanine ligase [Anaerolineaceae bacterium]